MMIVGVNPEKQKELWNFMGMASSFMSAYDKDGIGYAAMTDNGMFGERWLNPDDAFDYRPGEDKEQEEKVKRNFKGVIDTAKRYNSFSTVTSDEAKPIYAVLLHARMATCEKNIQNTHPFVRDGMALIHNGVITNVKQLKNVSSTCDSECILNEYVDHKVNLVPENIDKVAKALSGSYACGVFAKDKDGVVIMDIFRNRNPLFVGHVKEFDGMVVCTSETILRDTCKELNYTLSTTFRMSEDKLIRLNAKTGSIMNNYKFTEYSYNRHYEDYDYYKNTEWDSKTSSWVKKTDPTVEEVQQASVEENRSATVEEKKSHLALTSTISPKQIELAILAEREKSGNQTGSRGLGTESSIMEYTKLEQEAIDKMTDPFHWEGDGYGGYGGA